MKMFKSLFYDRTALAAVDNAMAHYSRDEFASPTRSTVPLLSLLKHEQPMVSSLLRDMGMPADSNLHLEYKVKPPKGSGQASQTDLMVLSDESSLAVEAKWTEPRYETVGEWLGKGSPLLNRCDVFTGWLGLLQQHVQHTLHQIDFSNAVYQMVHRAASASVIGGDPRLAYLVFKPSSDPRTADIKTIHDDLTHLWSLLGNPKGFPFYLVEVRLSPTAAFKEIASLAKGKEATAQQVSAALYGSDRLFGFEKYCVTRVGEKS